MKTILLIATLFFATQAKAHDWKANENPDDRESLRQHILDEWLVKQQSKLKAKIRPRIVSSTVITRLAALLSDSAGAPVQSKAFQAFPGLKLKWDEDYLYVGSNGLPDHNMMVGITAWQQQVPLPQLYIGDNAWRIPLHPVPAKTPAKIEGNFLRGAIALAVNGVPIFNPQNNRGEVSQEIGELDQWGGHCGRADDYHYHVAPLHLEKTVGKGNPIAFALDGYPIYGLTEPDGSPVSKLDDCHGHDSHGIGYHYHASTERPYLQSAFHGEVVEAGGQVDPQPRAEGVRPDTTPLRGARITGFESTGENQYKLSYEVGGDKRSVSYSIEDDGTYPFEFDNGSEGITREVFSRRAGGGGPQGSSGGAKGNGNGGPGGEMRPGDQPASGPGGEGRPPRPQAAVQGIPDANGDGVVTAQEFADNAKANATKNGTSPAEAMAKAKEQFNAFDHNRDGKLDTPELNELAGNGPREPRGDEPPARKGMPKAGDRGGRQEAFVALPDQPRSSDGKFMLNSSVVEDLKDLPNEFTGDGDGISPPLEWTGAPASTTGYALIMDHVAPGGDKKWYWTVYDIPANVTSLPKDSQTIGKIGTGFKGQVGYEPPHSKGPGAKTYVLTMYALSGPVERHGTPGREELLAAIKGKVLASSSLRVVHTSGSRSAGQEANRPKGPGGGEAKGKGGPGGKRGPPGLIKPGLDDTMRLNVYADNWFMLYVNGRLVAVDPIQFTPHNVVSVDFLPEYPMTIAVLAKDNADPKTGLEYGSNVGDGGFILKFGDGTVTNATWKAKNFFHGPVNGDTTNPQVKQEPLPANWWAVDFDDSAWKNATEFTVEEVDPKQPYFENDFEGATFIWSDDLALDNTIIFRTKIERPGWTQRWNTKPDLDVSGAPLR